ARIRATIFRLFIHSTKVTAIASGAMCIWRSPEISDSVTEINADSDEQTHQHKKRPSGPTAPSRSRAQSNSLLPSLFRAAPEKNPDLGQTSEMRATGGVRHC